MTDEERNRMMEFILEQQAQFAAGIQQLEEQMREREKEIARDIPRLKRLEESFQQLAQLEQIVDSRLDRLELTSVAQEAKCASYEDAIQRLNRLVETTRAKVARLEAT